MEVDKLIVTVAGFFGILFTYWFFLMKDEKETAPKNSSIDILVDGGYTPSNIVIPVGKTTKLNFLRKDKNSCLEEVVIGELHTRKFLPLNKKVTIELKPKEPAEIAFSCGMNMYHGKITVI